MKEDLYGAVLWPSSSAVASYLLTNVSNADGNEDFPLKGLSILELGAGNGLASIAASLGGASSVLATDYEQLPLHLLEYAKSHLNNKSEKTGFEREPRAFSCIDTGKCFRLYDVQLHFCETGYKAPNLHLYFILNQIYSSVVS